MSTTAHEETLARLKEKAEAEAETEEEATTEEEPEEPEAKKDSRREYIVLQQGGGKGDWVELDRTMATSAEDAISSLGDKLKNNATYAATPARNWHTKTATVQTTTSIKLT